MFAQTATQTPMQTQTPRQTASQTSASQDMNSSSGKTWTGILVSDKCQMSGMPKTTASDMSKKTSSSASYALGMPTSSANQQTMPQQTGQQQTADMKRGTATDRMSPRSTSSSSRGVSDMDRGTATDRADMNRDRARDVNQGTGGTDAQLERTRSMDQTGSANRSMQRGTPLDTQAGNNMAQATGELNNAGNWDRSCFVGKTTETFSFQTPDGRLLHFDNAANQQIKSQIDSANRVSTKDKIFRVRITGDIDSNNTIHLTNIVM